MTKNIRVVDEQGTDYGATYAKRAKGLVKNGRARFVDDNTLCLACPPNELIYLEDKMKNNNAENNAESSATNTAKIDNAKKVIEQAAMERVAVEMEQAAQTLGQTNLSSEQALEQAEKERERKAHEREQAALAREIAAQAKEQAAYAREIAAQAREQAAFAREQAYGQKEQADALADQAEVKKVQAVTSRVQSKVHTHIKERPLDPLIVEATEATIEQGFISTVMLQRRFAVGYARASKIISQMENLGIIGIIGSENNGKRNVNPDAEFILQDLTEAEENNSNSNDAIIGNVNQTKPQANEYTQYIRTSEKADGYAAHVLKNDILARIDKILDSSHHIQEACDAIANIPNHGTGDQGSPGDITGQAKAEAIGDIVKCRETTNQQALRFLEKMYDDLQKWNSKTPNTKD